MQTRDHGLSKRARRNEAKRNPHTSMRGKMKELYMWVIGALGTALIGVITYFASDFKKRMENDNALLTGRFQKQMETTRKLIRQHTQNMGKATKSINGDMLQIKQQFVDFKDQVFDITQDMKSAQAEMQRQSEIITTRMELAIEKYESKASSLKKLIEGKEDGI